MAEIKLKKRYKYSGDIFQKLIGIGFDIETATAFLDEVEDADVVEVVRCKDCKYYETDIWDGEILCGCGNSSGLNDDKPDGYCCYGERRKENVFCQEKEV